MSAISPAVFAQVKSGPDVFADALVPQKPVQLAWRFRSPRYLKVIDPIVRGARAGIAIQREGRGVLDAPLRGI